MLRRALMGTMSLLMAVLAAGCTANKDIATVKEFPTEDHKAIYERLEKSREHFNARKTMTLEGFTEDARLMVRQGDEKVVVSAEELVAMWPQRLEEISKHRLKCRTIEVKSLNITGDTADLVTERTYYSSRWREHYRYEMHKVYKKVDQEWKLHRLRFEKI